MKSRALRDDPRDLFNQFQPSPADTIFKHYETGGVAVWPRETLN